MATTLFGWRPSALVAACPSVDVRALLAAQAHALGRSAVSSLALGAVDGGVARGSIAVNAAGYGFAALAINPATAGLGTAEEPLPLAKPGKAVNGSTLDNSIGNSTNGTTSAAHATEGATTSNLSDTNPGNQPQQVRVAAIPTSKRDMVTGGVTRGIPPRGRRRV